MKFSERLEAEQLFNSWFNNLELKKTMDMSLQFQYVFIWLETTGDGKNVLTKLCQEAEKK